MPGLTLPEATHEPLHAKKVVHQGQVMMLCLPPLVTAVAQLHLMLPLAWSPSLAATASLSVLLLRFVSVELAVTGTQVVQPLLRLVTI